MYANNRIGLGIEVVRSAKNTGGDLSDSYRLGGAFGGSLRKIRKKMTKDLRPAKRPASDNPVRLLNQFLFPRNCCSLGFHSWQHGAEPRLP